MKARRNLLLIIALLIAAGLVFFIERPFDRSGRTGDGDLLVFPDFEPWKVNKIQIDKDRLVFENREGNWFLVTPSGSYPADREQISALLQAIRELKRDNIASESEGKQALFGVRAGEGTHVATFDLDGQKMLDFYVGKKGPDGLSAYIRRADSDEIILQPGTLRIHLDKPAKYWRDRRLFNFKPEEVIQITLQTGKDVIVLSRDTKGGWFVIKPLSSRADGGRVEQILSVMNELEVEDFADQLKPEEAGLTAPQWRLALQLKDRTTKMMIFGKQTDEGNVYAMAGEGKSIFLVQNGVVQMLFPDVRDLEAPAAADAQQKP